MAEIRWINNNKSCINIPPVDVSVKEVKKINNNKSCINIFLLLAAFDLSADKQ